MNIIQLRSTFISVCRERELDLIDLEPLNIFVKSCVFIVVIMVN